MGSQLEKIGLSSDQATVQLLARASVLEQFAAYGFTRMAHHSGLGGYTKLLIPDLLPASVRQTIVLDSDTLIVNDVGALWTALRQTSASKVDAVLAAKRLSTGGACLRGQRINSGVVLMNLNRMRELNWTSTMLHRLAKLSQKNVPARLCGKLVRNGSLAAGDQELLSYGCLSSDRGVCMPLPHGVHQDKCDGMSGGGQAVVLHFVRRWFEHDVLKSPLSLHVKHRLLALPSLLLLPTRI